jgi:hypothetical protein
VGTNPGYPANYPDPHTHAWMTEGWTIQEIPIFTTIEVAGNVVDPSSFISGIANTSTSDSTLIIPLVSLRRIFVSSLSIVNTGATTTLISLQSDLNGRTLWETIAPAGGGSNVTLEVPVPTDVGVPLCFQAANASATVYVSVSGYVDY